MSYTSRTHQPVSAVLRPPQRSESPPTSTKGPLSLLQLFKILGSARSRWFGRGELRLRSIFLGMTAHDSTDGGGTVAQWMQRGFREVPSHRSAPSLWTNLLPPAEPSPGCLHCFSGREHSKGEELYVRGARDRHCQLGSSYRGKAVGAEFGIHPYRQDGRESFADPTSKNPSEPGLKQPSRNATTPGPADETFRGSESPPPRGEAAAACRKMNFDGAEDSERLEETRKTIDIVDIADVDPNSWLPKTHALRRIIGEIGIEVSTSTPQSEKHIVDGPAGVPILLL